MAAALAMPRRGSFTAPVASFRIPSLPWAITSDDERRFKRIAKRVLFIVLLLGLLMPFLPLPKIERTEVQPLPAPIAKLLLDQAKPKPPPPPPKQDLADNKVENAKPEPAPDKPAPIKPLKKDQPPVPEARDPKPNKPPGEALDNARRKASGVGLLAMKDQLSELHSAPAAAQLKQDIKPGPGVGTGVGVGVGAGQDAGIPIRSMITSNATGGSGGINTAAYSRDTGGGGLAGRGTTLVEGVAGGGGGGGYGGGGGRAGGGTGDGSGVGGGGKGGTLTKSASGKASRSIEEIKLVFERNKGAIYAIYNRALRDEPALQGKVVLELKIAPSGEVSGLRLVSSELKNDELEKKLLARIRSFDFGAKDVEVMVVTWPVDFLPS
jgi:periplasmic protein TonB